MKKSHLPAIAAIIVLFIALLSSCQSGKSALTGNESTATFVPDSQHTSSENYVTKRVIQLSLWRIEND